MWSNLMLVLGAADSTRVLIPRYLALGTSNNKLELRRAALLAALSNRSLCLPPIVHGRTGDTTPEQVPISELYDLEALGRFVSIGEANACDATRATATLCGDLCRRDGGPRTGTIVVAGRGVPNDALRAVDALGLADVFVASGCLFWPQIPISAYLLLWHHLYKPPAVLRRVALARNTLFGGQAYVSVHWRFEEYKCGRKRRLPLGLCQRETFSPVAGPMLVVTPQQLADVVVAAAADRPVFLATDGRLRGHGRLVDEVKSLVAQRTQIRELHDAPASLSGLSASAVMELEQGICADSAFHLGSGMSSWDWEIFYTRALRMGDLATFETAFHLENLHREIRGPAPDELKRAILAPRPDAPFALLDVHLREMVNRTSEYPGS